MNCPGCFKPYTHANDVGIPGLKRPCDSCLRHGPPPCPAWADGAHCYETREEIREMAGYLLQRGHVGKRCACGAEVKRV